MRYANSQERQLHLLKLNAILLQASRHDGCPCWGLGGCGDGRVAGMPRCSAVHSAINVALDFPSVCIRAGCGHQACQQALRLFAELRQRHTGRPGRWYGALDARATVGEHPWHKGRCGVRQSASCWYSHTSRLVLLLAQGGGQVGNNEPAFGTSILVGTLEHLFAIMRVLWLQFGRNRWATRWDRGSVQATAEPKHWAARAGLQGRRYGDLQCVGMME